MEFVKRWIAQIQAQLTELPLSTKLFIGSMVIVLGMALLLTALLVGQRDMVPLLDNLAGVDQAQVTGYLDARNIPYQIEGGRLMVPTEQRFQVLAAMQAQQMLPEEQSGFTDLVERQSWWHSVSQAQQQYDIALQQELGRMIKRMRGVDSASVILSRPSETGFDTTRKHPSASVNVIPTAEKIDRDTAEAIGAMVAGSVAEMQPEHVTVIDARNGRQFRNRNEEQLMATDFLEMVQTQEQLYRGRIADALGYIPDIIVAVNVELDAKRKQSEGTRYNQDDSVSLIASESSRSETSTQPGSGGEPGVRSNAGLDIAGAGGGGGQQEMEESENTFEAHAGFITERIIDPGGTPTRINATVNVPRSYFVKLHERGQPDQPEDAPPPTDADLQPIYDEHLQRIKAQVEPLVSADGPGRVVVDVYPDGTPQVALAGAGGMGDGQGGLFGVLTIGRVLIGGLAAAAIGAMLLMLRMAGREPETPSPEELAGLPPQYGEDGGMVGEANLSESALEGYELDEDAVANRQVTQQVASMVKNNPDEAAQLLKQWIRNEA